MSRNHRRALGATVVACGLATTPLITPSAHPAIPAESCPDVRNHVTNPLARGDTVQGLTVSSGKATDTFTGEVVGVLDDGIAPGFDMILAELEGSLITDEAGAVSAGVWAGMSGSPVYDETGSLIGAVAYSLTFGPSDLAGITPATEMFALRQAAAPARVTIADPMAARVVADTEATPAQVSGGMRRLPMPVTVSGIGSGARAAERLDRLVDAAGLAALSFTGGGARAAVTEVVDAMVPGGNVGASLSYGDVTAVGVGTVTAVCGEQVLAFGHPMLFTGDSRLTMHGADALGIVRSPVFGAFKLANPTAPVGGVVQDRLAAIMGIEGPTAVPAVSTVASDVRSQGRRRLGTTLSSVADELPFITALHVLVNGDRVFDRIARGTATVRWRVQIERRQGPLLTYARGDRIVSPFDLSVGLATDAFEQLSLIQGNRFEDVRIADVDVAVAMQTGMQTLQVRRLQYRTAGRWVTLGRSSVLHRPAGSVLRLRTRLEPPRGSEAAARWTRLSLPLPDRAADMRGRLQVIGGNAVFSRPSGATLPELVDSMANATRNDVVLARLRVGRPAARVLQRSTDAPTTAVVNGRVGVRLVVH